MERHSHLEDMFDQAQTALSCPVCHRTFERDELRLRGLLERHGIIQASCSTAHNPTIVIFIADEKSGGAKTQSEAPMTANDVRALHRALESFDGDFRKHLKRNS